VYEKIEKPWKFAHSYIWYGTAQFQGNIRMRLERVKDMPRMCVRRVQNTFETCPERAWDASMQAQNLMIKLQQDLM